MTTRSLHVGVNLLWLVPGHVGGSEEYVTRQLDALRTMRPDLALTLFVVKGFVDAYPTLAAGTTVVEAPVDGHHRPRRVWAETTWLPRAVRRSGVSIMHHAGGTMPARLGVPAVLTIHDLQYFMFPDTFSRVKLRWLQWSVPRAVARATVVAVPSQFVADDVIERFGTRPDRVVVVPNAAPSIDDAATPLDRLRAKYDLPGRFIVYPAITYHHKNHITLVRAFATLVATEPSLRLILLGGKGPAEDVVRTLIADLGLVDAVVRPGRVPAADRDGLYEHASALAFPSRYEGFGVPVLEAFAHGLPVVAARATALPDAVGDAGVLVDPLDTNAWAVALASVLNDPDRAASLRDAGARRAATFSSAVSAEALADAYGRVAAASDLS
jgi:glycosyltransferase involved in cell wall biosynthesis